MTKLSRRNFLRLIPGFAVLAPRISKDLFENTTQDEQEFVVKPKRQVETFQDFDYGNVIASSCMAFGPGWMTTGDE